MGREPNDGDTWLLKSILSVGGLPRSASPEVDVSRWAAGGVEPLGTKPKCWLIDPDGRWWLFKEATFNRRADGTSYAKGDDWSERVASVVANLLGVPAAETDLAVAKTDHGRVHGVISRKVLDDRETLIHGNELLAESGVTGLSQQNRSGYTPLAVQRALTGVKPPTHHDHLTAWEWWVGYLVLDAVIGNTDRHQENWAVIGDEERRLAPTFDHASSLGFQLDDERRLEHLSTRDRNRTVAAYAGRARSKFDGSPHPCDVACTGLRMVRPSVRRHWMDRLESLTDVEKVLATLPSHRISDPARCFAAALVATNRARLLSQAMGTLGS